MGIRNYSFQPNLPPVRIDAPGTEQPAFAVTGLAYHRIQNDAGALHLLHLSRLLIYDLGDALKDLVGSAAVGCQFRIPPHATVHVLLVASLAVGVRVPAASFPARRGKGIPPRSH